MSPAPPGPVVVFGGGGLGSAIARLAASRGAPVTVASRTPREHVGWWRAHRVGGEESIGWLPARSRVFIAIGPVASEPAARAWGPGFSAWFGRLCGLRPASVLLAGPAGESGPGSDEFAAAARAVRAMGGAVLRMPALLCTGSGWVGGLAADLRAGRRPRVSTNLPPARLLCAEDAARAAWVEAEGGGEVTVTGAERLEAAAVVAALCHRYGQEVRSRLLGTGIPSEYRARLAAQADLPDAWDTESYGPRTDFASWVDRLPGPRRRRAP